MSAAPECLQGPCSRRWRPHRLVREFVADEQGGITFLTMAVVFFFLMLGAFLFDANQALQDQMWAQGVASQSARNAASSLSGTSVRNLPGGVAGAVASNSLVAPTASASATWFLQNYAEPGMPATVSVSNLWFAQNSATSPVPGVSANTVRVCVRWSYHPVFLSALGVGDWVSVSCANATPVTGP